MTSSSVVDGISKNPEDDILQQFAVTFTVDIGWQWRNFFIPIYASCSGRHDAVQGNVITLSPVIMYAQVKI